MIPIFALSILIFIYFLGELVAEKSKAILSATLFIALTLLNGFWLGLPKTIFADSKVIDFSMLTVGILITSLGTRIDFEELKKQWKTVIISVIGITVCVFGIIFIGSNIIGRNLAMAGAPIFAGANASSLVMIAALKEKGLENLSIFCIMMLVTQNFIGIPVASQLLRKEASNFLKYAQLNKLSSNKIISKGNTKKKMINFPTSFNRPSFYIFKLCIVASLANYLSILLNNKIHYFVFALLLGIIFCELGFLEKDILNKTNSSELILFLTTIVIFTNLANTNPSNIVTMLVPLLICLILGVLLAILSGIILSKLLKTGVFLTIALILTCTFGFPTTLFMPREVAKAYSSNDKEYDALVKYLEKTIA